MFLRRAFGWLAERVADVVGVPAASFEAEALTDLLRARRQLADVGEALGLGRDWDPDECMDLVRSTGELVEWQDEAWLHVLADLYRGGDSR